MQQDIMIGLDIAKHVFQVHGVDDTAPSGTRPRNTVMVWTACMAVSRSSASAKIREQSRDNDTLLYITLVIIFLPYIVFLLM